MKLNLGSLAWYSPALLLEFEVEMPHEEGEGGRVHHVTMVHNAVAFAMALGPDTARTPCSVAAALEHVHFVKHIPAAVHLLVGRLHSQRIREGDGMVFIAVEFDDWRRLVGVPPM